MPLDPQIEAMLAAAAGLPPLETLTVAEARARYEGRPRPPAPEVARVQDVVVPGPAGGMGVRVYTPDGPGPHPLLVFVHGSGFVLCSLDTHDGMCRNLCVGAGCVVASVDYRLAPEARFPAATDDCLAAARWAGEHARALGADEARIAIGGDSAGGNLAAVTALRIRDEGGPALAGQVLLYPVTTHYEPPTASMLENGEGYGLTRSGMKWFWDHYLGPDGEASHPHAAPLQAADLSRLPPALILTAEFDPLRDEGEAYGDRLRQAGVAATIVRWPGVNHGFLGSVGWVKAADGAMAEACAWLRGVFAR